MSYTMEYELDTDMADANSGTILETIRGAFGEFKIILSI